MRGTGGSTSQKRQRDLNSESDDAVKRNEVKKKMLKIEKNSDAESDEEEYLAENVNVLSPYELNRLENIRKNEEMFKELNFDEVKIKISTGNQQARGLAREKKPKKPKGPQEPRRQSLRIRNIKPTQEVINIAEEVYPEQHPRKPPGPIEMNATNNVDEDDHKKWLKSVATLSIKRNKVKMSVCGDKELDLKSYTKSINSLSLTEEHVIKVVPERIFSLAVHPMEEKTLVFVGDKWGHVGVWDTNSKSGQDGVYLYEPHSRPINYMRLNPIDSTKLHTCSYDGTIRCGDLNKEVFIESYASPEEMDIRYNSFGFVSGIGTSLLLADSDGNVDLLDLRTGKMEQTFSLHAKSTRGLDCHPNNPHLFVTGSFDGQIALWDLRKIKGRPSTLSLMRASKSVSSVYFSPLTGNKVLATSMDDLLSVFSINSETRFDEKPAARIRHNNHTGRWLTKFRATWDPKTDNCFTVGSMARPRQLDVYTSDNKGSVVAALTGEYMTSVSSITVFHPTKNILVGGNSSGRAFLWE